MGSAESSNYTALINRLAHLATRYGVREACKRRAGRRSILFARDLIVIPDIVHPGQVRFDRPARFESLPWLFLDRARRA